MRVAVTGGICDGKSTVLSILGNMGFSILSSDEVVHELHASEDFRSLLLSEFGESAVQGNEVNKDWIRLQVVKSPDFRRKLNSISHRPVLKRVVQFMSLQPGHCFVEVPLLVESVSFRLFDKVWCVDAGDAVRMARLTERLGGDEALAREMLKTQLKNDVKNAFADNILRTDLALSSVKLLIEKLAADLG